MCCKRRDLTEAPSVIGEMVLLRVRAQQAESHCNFKGS